MTEASNIRIALGLHRCAHDHALMHANAPNARRTQRRSDDPGMSKSSAPARSHGCPSCLRCQDPDRIYDAVREETALPSGSSAGIVCWRRSLGVACQVPPPSPSWTWTCARSSTLTVADLTLKTLTTRAACAHARSGSCGLRIRRLTSELSRKWL
jgi:hypothetical protein